MSVVVRSTRITPAWSIVYVGVHARATARGRRDTKMMEGRGGEGKDDVHFVCCYFFFLTQAHLRRG